MGKASQVWIDCNNELAESAWRGARLLDEFDPAWVIGTNYDRLNMASPYDCVLGQGDTRLNNSYFARLGDVERWAWENNFGDLLDMYDDWQAMDSAWFASRFGFDLRAGLSQSPLRNSCYGLLTAVWKYELLYRRTHAGRRTSHPLAMLTLDFNDPGEDLPRA